MSAERISLTGDGQMMRPLISVINKSIHPRPDFTEILEAMKMEKGVLLQPTLKSLVESYEAGLACALIDGERPVGYVRFSPLLEVNLKDKLALDDNIPDIYEIGSAIILPDHRGKGYYPRLRNGLLNLVADKVNNKELLVIGTTKSIKVIEVLEHATDLGINFSLSRHGEYPGIQCLTCVCKPDFGYGVQHDIFVCPKTITESELAALQNIPDYQTHKKEVDSLSTNGQIPCVLYISDKDLARRTSDVLISKLGSIKKFVKELKGQNYYE
jgi:hypothetical protein